jgi:hypothetical protein
MILGVLVLAAIVVTIVVLVGRSGRPDTSARPLDRAAGREPTDRLGDQLADRLDDWVAAGLLGTDQAAAIRSHESDRAIATLAPLPATVPGPAVIRPARAPMPTGWISELLAYLGAVLTIAGTGLLVAARWGDMSSTVRLGIGIAATVGLLAAGAFVPIREATRRALFRAFVWTLGTATGAFVAGYLTDLVLGSDHGQEVAIAVTATIAVFGGLLWWGHRDRPAQQVACYAGTALVIGITLELVAGDLPAGTAVWALGLALLLLRRRPMFADPVLTTVAGAVTMLAGAATMASNHPQFGLPAVLLTALGFLTAVSVRDVVPDHGGRLALAIIGAIGAFQALPSTLGYFAAEAGLVTGLVVWTAGLGVLATSRHPRLRSPLLPQLAGAVALVGGAALTGTQVPGAATLFGILTAAALLVLGTRPGWAAVSTVGAIGLLIHVPWAIAHFFPGEGRAPLLITVSGALLMLMAFVLTRLAPRLRAEAQGPTAEPPPAEVTAAEVTAAPVTPLAPDDHHPRAA